MKKILYSFAGLAVLALAASCSQEENLITDGEGSISIRTSVCTDVEVESRATDGLEDNCLIWISGSKGLVRKYDGVADVPSSIKLLSGHYVAEAWAGDSVSASFDKRWFKGRTEFDVTKGQNTEVAIKCTVANVVASVNYAEGLEDVLTDFTMTVGHDRGSLTFEGRDERKGYFMMPSTDKNLTYTLKGTQIDGKEFTHTGQILDAKPATEYALTVKYTPVSNEVGGAVFTITVDKTEITIRDEREIIAAPKIEGYGFDMSQPVMGAQGTIGQRSVYVTSATKVTSVILKSKAFESITAIGGDDFDILNQSAEGNAAVKAAGISLEDNSGADNAMLKIVFASAFIDALTDGEYPVEITATDNKGKTSTATLNLIVSDAPVQTLPVVAESTTMRTATLRGRTSKEVASAGFKYRPVGSSEWTSVDAVAASRSIAADTEFTAEVSGLEADTQYEYVSVCQLTTGGEFTSAVMTFTTLDGPQLPNADMEGWSSQTKPRLIYADGGEMFWDSGNHGSKTAGSDITTPDGSVKHSGNYSAKLETNSLYGVIAAGNLFVGSFIGTENMTKGILGWGRPFDFSQGQPKAMKVWVKYSPQNITKKGEYKGSDFNVGDPDKGIIYIALLDDSKMSYKNNSYPVIVRTADLENYSFKKDGANVIGYGEHILAEATPGSGMVEITIPIETKREGVTPSNILVVCSASQYGDYYCGGKNSTMWVDDFKLVY